MLDFYICGDRLFKDPCHGGIALFHTVLRNLGRTTSSRIWAMWVKVGRCAGRFFVAEGRAGWGQEKYAEFSIFKKVRNSIKENRVWKIVCGKLCTHLANVLHHR